MNYNPALYEINIRTFLKRFGKNATLENIPHDFWLELRSKGIDYVWLMGIWKTCEKSIDKYCFEDYLIKSYDKALSDWRREDVIGSPFAIDRYEVNPRLGSEESLLKLKKQLNKIGIKLILDFVPNHFGADTSLLSEIPEIFLRVEKSNYLKDSHTFFKPFDEEGYYAHGRDPFFPAWQDTIQVNLLSRKTRSYYIETLKNITNLCDGIRCDMAMLAMNNVFKNTWAGVYENSKTEASDIEFWEEIIGAVRLYRSDFIFIAEAYWDLEWKLQQQGFDYTYDKKLTDRITAGYVRDIHDHLKAEESYQKKSVRFIENHDEERSLALLGKEKALAAAVIISTIQGMRFYFDGQFEGKKIKLPIQLGREPVEAVNKEIKDFYEKLLKITSSDVFKKGKWKLLEPEPAWEGNSSHLNMLSWEWRYKNKNCLVVINFSDKTSTCRLKFDLRNYDEVIVLNDLLNDKIYRRNSEEIIMQGLYIELKPYSSHIFIWE
ncbi:alpha-amylase family glycosyl hydrolase [Melioribacter sp. OK-6-Me]|uniref:alpha-amylase family glycosyl hydrolase n=1 Tax=unclassified Melioribacter TaxID=2627329 RepID=UPI003ED8E2D3